MTPLPRGRWRGRLPATMVAVLLASLAAPLLTRAEADLGRALLRSDDLAQLLYYSNPSRAAKQEFLPPDADGRRALQVTVTQSVNQAWDIGLRRRLAGPILAGDWVVIVCELRGTSAVREAGHQAYAEFVLEQAAPPYGKVGARQVPLTAQWQTLTLVVPATDDLPGGTGQVGVNLGFGVQTVALRRLEVTAYERLPDAVAAQATPLTYAGREEGAAWRQRALRRIRHYRTGELRVIVQDAAGQPVPGATVAARLERPAFQFGTAINASHLLPPTADSALSPRDHQLYLARLPTLFTAAVPEDAFKWPYLAEHGYDDADRLATYTREHRLALRGHTLVWPGWPHLPGQMRLLANQPDAFRRELERHLGETVARYRETCYAWDVVNEPLDYDDVEVTLGTDALADCFRLAHAADPAAQLVLNEHTILTRGGVMYDRQQRLQALLERLRAAGAPVHAIGLQSHFDGACTPPLRLRQLFRDLSRHGQRLYLTEYDHDCPDPLLQADYLRDVLLVAYAEPAVQGFWMWGFWDGAHWRRNAPLYYQDWFPKPAADVWRLLVLGHWRTEAQASTDRRGRALLRGHHGAYTLTVTAGPRHWQGTVNLDSRQRTTVRCTLP